jgi:hypothetical protein
MGCNDVPLDGSGGAANILGHIPEHILHLPHDERIAAIAAIEAQMPKSSREIHLTGDVVSLLRLLETAPNLGAAVHNRMRDVKLALTRYGIIYLHSNDAKVLTSDLNNQIS